MSDDMVERVARVLEPLAWAALGLLDTERTELRREFSLHKARLAIGAMREPTEAMEDAVYNARIGITGADAWLNASEAVQGWQAMIDAALERKKNTP